MIQKLSNGSWKTEDLLHKFCRENNLFTKVIRKDVAVYFPTKTSVYRVHTIKGGAVRGANDPVPEEFVDWLEKNKSNLRSLHRMNGGKERQVKAPASVI